MQPGRGPRHVPSRQPGRMLSREREKRGPYTRGQHTGQAATLLIAHRQHTQLSTARRSLHFPFPPAANGGVKKGSKKPRVCSVESVPFRGSQPTAPRSPPRRPPPSLPLPAPPPRREAAAAASGSSKVKLLPFDRNQLSKTKNQYGAQSGNRVLIGNSRLSSV